MVELCQMPEYPESQFRVGNQDGVAAAECVCEFETGGLPETTKLGECIVANALPGVAE